MCVKNTFTNHLDLRRRFNVFQLVVLVSWLTALMLCFILTGMTGAADVARRVSVILQIHHDYVKL